VFVGLLVLVTAVLFVVSLETREASLPHRITAPLADATLAATVLAAIVDPYIKTRFASEIGADFFWAITNPESPPEFRALMNNTASAKRYREQTRWDLIFSWTAEPESSPLKVEIRIRSWGLNLDRGGYTPGEPLWVVASTTGFESTYDRWHFEVPDSHFDEEISGAALREFVDLEADGGISLDQKKLVATFDPIPVVSPGQRFVTERQTTMFRQPRGYVPLVAGSTTMSTRVRCSGPAVERLLFRFLDGADGEYGPLMGDPVTFVVPGASIQGQMLLVSFKPLGEATERERQAAVHEERRTALEIQEGSGVDTLTSEAAAVYRSEVDSGVRPL
jgi:hypothetical protein